ncbi:MAG TPA: hypothetical protein DCF45_06030 [Gammaproteobacteria bacterium]|nr:hypothetical protein [Gammaproteobacteria bacterium]
MDASKTKQRLVGVVVLCSLAVILLPALVDYQREPERHYDIVEIPPQPKYEDYYPRVVPIDTSRLDALGSEQGAVTRTLPGNDLPPTNQPPENGPASNQKEQQPDRQSTAQEKQKTAETRVVKAVEEPPEAERPAAREGWVVQVGTFSEFERADKVRRALAGKQFKVFVEPVDTDKGTLYRVRVGPEMSRSAAEKALEKIKTGSDFSGVVLKFP